MNKKTIDSYMGLEYPVAYKKTEDGYEVWYPDFGRYAIVSVNKRLSRAIKELEEGRKATTEFLLERGLEVPEPDEDLKENFSGRFMLRVPKDLHARLAREAHRNGVSLNSYIIHLLSEKHLTNGAGKATNGKVSRRKAVAAST